MSFDGPRIPLHDERVEGYLLGGMMLQQRVADAALDRLDASDFYRPAHQLIFEAMREIRLRGQVPDTIVVGNYLESIGKIKEAGGEFALDELTLQVSGINNYSSWIDLVREKASLRDLERSLAVSLAEIHSGKSASEIASGVVSLCGNVGGSTSTIVEAGDVKPKGPDKGLTTGFRLIDNETSTNGAPTGQLCIITAREGVGKSTGLVQIATHGAWKRRGQLYISLADLNQDRLQPRILRIRCGYSRRESAERDGELALFNKTEAELKYELSFGIDDRTKRGSRDVDDIIASIEARRLKLLGAAIPLQEVYLDYVQKLRSRHFSPKDSYAMSVYCCDQLTNYAENSGLVIWGGSQITQGNKKQETDDNTKGGRHWQEESAITLKIEAGTNLERKFTLLKSRYGGQWMSAPMVFDEDRLCFREPGVQP